MHEVVVYPKDVNYFIEYFCAVWGQFWYPICRGKGFHFGYFWCNNTLCFLEILCALY